MSSENNSGQGQSSFNDPNQYGPPSPPEDIEPYQWQYNDSQQQGGGGNEWEYYQRDYGSGGSLSHATFKQSISQFFNKWNDFRGFASRGEFWFAQLFLFLVYTGLLFFFLICIALFAETSYYSTVMAGFFHGLSIVGMITTITASILLIVPEISVTVRRLHDAGVTGWLVVLYVFPVVWLVVPVVATLPTSPLSKYRSILSE